MTQAALTTGYFRWLCSFICFDPEKRYSTANYSKLLTKLFRTPYRFKLSLDVNRYDDGITMRYQYGADANIDDRIVAAELDIRDCTILEMLVAVCVKCEQQIMRDNEQGDRTGEWFWDAIEGLNLESMTDDNYDEEHVDAMLYIFEDSGIIFDVPKYGIYSTYDIWWQLNRHLAGKEGV